MKKTLLAIILGILTAMVIVHFVQPVIVSGESMHPYLENGDFMFIEKWDTEPDYNDVIVFQSDDRLLIKRVIGKPGDKIEYMHGDIYVNDERRHEDFIVFETDPGEDVTLGENEYYVLGDNRSESLDSRIIGPISQESIIGIAKIRVFPRPGKLWF